MDAILVKMTNELSETQNKKGSSKTEKMSTDLSESQNKKESSKKETEKKDSTVSRKRTVTQPSATRANINTKARERSIDNRNQNTEPGTGSTASSVQQPSCSSVFAPSSELSGFACVMKTLMAGFQESISKNFTNLQDSINGLYHNEYEESLDYEDYDYDEECMAPPQKKSKGDSGGETQISPVDMLLRRSPPNEPSLNEQTNGSIVAEDNPTSFSDSQDENILSAIAQKMNIKEQVGPPVNQQLSEIINGLLFKSDKPDFDRMKENMETIKRPENCKSLVTTRVDELIWMKLAAQSRTLDTKFQAVQTGLIKAVTILTQTVDNILVKRNSGDVAQDCDDVLRQIFDAIELIAYSNYELNLRRRDCIKPELNDEYLGLFSLSVPINEWLFGGNTSKRLEDIDKCNKVVNKAMSFAPGKRRGRARGVYRPFGRRGRGRGFNGYGSRYKPFSYGGGFGMGRGGSYGSSFLGRGFTHARPKRRGDGKKK